MTHRLSRMARRAYPFLAAGVLFQTTTGCDTGALAAELVGLVVQQLIAGFVFGAFNLVP